MHPLSRSLIITVSTASALLLAPVAQAQYVGPSTTPTYKTVTEVLKNPVDDTPVLLEGILSKKVGKKKYMFSDGVAEIRVEIDPRDLPPSVLISDTTRVRLQGEVEKDFMESPEIDVKQVTVIR